MNFKHKSTWSPCLIFVMISFCFYKANKTKQQQKPVYQLTNNDVQSPCTLSLLLVVAFSFMALCSLRSGVIYL